MINIKQTTVTKQFNSTVHCAVVTLHKMSKPTVAVWMKSDDWCSLNLQKQKCSFTFLTLQLGVHFYVVITGSTVVLHCCRRMQNQ